MDFKVERSVSIGTLINVGALLVACAAAYFTLQQGVSDAGEDAARAEKLSTRNTEQISTLKEIVSELTSSIAIQNNTATHLNEIQKLKTDHLEERLDDLKERIDRSGN